MINKHYWYLILLAAFLLPFNNVYAHPADEYYHDHKILVMEDQIDLIWLIIPGPLLAEMIWNEADLNSDGKVTSDEAAEWATIATQHLQFEFNQTGKTLTLDRIDWPDDMISLYTGVEPIQIYLYSSLSNNIATGDQIRILNTYKPTISVIWFSIESQPSIGFDLPEQVRGDLRFTLESLVINIH